MNPPTAKRDVPEKIRECFCDRCGRVAPSWFHSDFLMHRDGFTCVDCIKPKKD